MVEIYNMQGEVIAQLGEDLGCTAAHEHEHLDKCIEAFKKVRREIEG